MANSGLFWGADLLSITNTPEVIVDKLLWRGQTVMLIAQEKVGKSVVAVQLACCLTTGAPLFGELAIPKPRDVLYMQFEGTRFGTQARLQSMSSKIGINKEKFFHLYDRGIALDTEKGCAAVQMILDEHGIRPEVFIIDPLYMCVSGGLCNEMAAREFVKTTRRFIDKYDAAVFIVHHTHRPRADEFGRGIDEGDNAIFGSFVWKAFADHTLLLTKAKETHQRVLTCQTQRDGEVPDTIKFFIRQRPLECTLENVPEKERAK